MSQEQDLPQRSTVQHKQQETRDLSRRTVLVDGITVLFILALAAVYVASDALLLVFACILFAIFLYKLSEMLRKQTHLSPKLSLTAVVLVLLGVFVGGGWLMAPQISEQSSQLAQAVPQSLQRMRAMLESHEWLRFLVKQMPSPEQMSQHLARMVPNAGLFFAGIAGAVGNVVIIFFVGIYLAAAPRQYLNGVVKLVPQR